MKKVCKSIGSFFADLWRKFLGSFVWMAKNKVVVMQFFREIMITAAPLLILVGFPLHYLLHYLNKDTTVAFNLVLLGLLAYAVYCAFSVVYFIIKAVNIKALEKLEKKPETEEVAEESATKDEAEAPKAVKETKKTTKQAVPTTFWGKVGHFFKKLWEGIRYNEDTVKAITNGLMMAGCLVVFFMIFDKFYYWDIYYHYVIILWAIFIFGLIELLYVKDKKSLISIVIGSVALLVMLIIVTPKVNLMYYGFAEYTNTNEFDILMIITTFISMFQLRMAMANGYITKFKRTRNIGLGFISLAAGIVLYFVKDVTKVLAESYKDVPLWESLGNQLIPMKIMWIVYSVMIGVVVVNISANLIIYFKTKNYLGIFDLMCAVTGTVVGTVGMYNMVYYLIWFRR